MNDLDPVSRLHRAAADTPSAPELDPGIVSSAADRRAPRLIRPGRVVRGAGAVLAATAAVSAGALVVGNVLAPTAPLFTAAASAGGGGESAAFATDSRIAMWVDYRYLAGEGLSTDGGRGTVYQLRRTGDANGVLRTTAQALGLAGDPRPASYSSPDYPSSLIGPEDGSGASLTLTWAGTGDWWYNDPKAYPEPVCVEVPATAEDGSDASYQDCTQPEIPASESRAPGEQEARRLAARLFAATGLDVDPAQIRVTADSWQTIATANLVVGGTKTALEWSVAWSPLGTISWAAGHSIEVVERGGFDTVSTAAAVDRLSDWRWFGAAGPDYVNNNAVMYAADGMMARGAEASDAPAPTDGMTEPAPETPTDAPSTEPSDGTTTDPGTDPLPEPEPLPAPTPETVTVTLEHAESTLLLLWDADGNAWLVPGYAFENPDGGFWNAVVSLVEGVIRLPEPVEVQPLPAEVQ